MCSPENNMLAGGGWDNSHVIVGLSGDWWSGCWCCRVEARQSAKLAGNIPPLKSYQEQVMVVGHVGEVLICVAGVRTMTLICVARVRTMTRSKILTLGLGALKEQFNESEGLRGFPGIEGR